MATPLFYDGTIGAGWSIRKVRGEYVWTCADLASKYDETERSFVRLADWYTEEDALAMLDQCDIDAGKEWCDRDGDRLVEVEQTTKPLRMAA